MMQTATTPTAASAAAVNKEKLKLGASSKMADMVVLMKKEKWWSNRRKKLSFFFTLIKTFALEGESETESLLATTREKRDEVYLQTGKGFSHEQQQQLLIQSAQPQSHTVCFCLQFNCCILNALSSKTTHKTNKFGKWTDTATREETQKNRTCTQNMCACDSKAN